MMGNSTAEMQAMIKHGGSETLMNVLVFSAWIGAFVTAITALLGVAYRKYRAKPQEAGYSLLE